MKQGNLCLLVAIWPTLEDFHDKRLSLGFCPFAP